MVIVITEIENVKIVRKLLNVSAMKGFNEAIVLAKKIRPLTSL